VQHSLSFSLRCQWYLFYFNIFICDSNLDFYISIPFISDSNLNLSDMNVLEAEIESVREEKLKAKKKRKLEAAANSSDENR
jgi:hypothetical protein